jgi:hypothetical protein
VFEEAKAGAMGELEKADVDVAVAIAGNTT